MTDEKESEMTEASIKRRAMIKASMAAGAAAWIAPIIIDSIDSPAAAETPHGLPTSCSYALVVFTFQGHTYVMKIESGLATCAGDDTTSNDTSFTQVCGANTFSSVNGMGGSSGLLENGSPISTALPNPCNDMFLVSGDTVSVKPFYQGSVLIIFGVSHTSNQFFPQCVNNGNSVTFTC
jgi:hypothetical protein